MYLELKISPLYPICKYFYSCFQDCQGKLQPFHLTFFCGSSQNVEDQGYGTGSIEQAYHTSASGVRLNSVTRSPREAIAKTKKPSGLSTEVNPYLAASAAASEQTIAFPNCKQKPQNYEETEKYVQVRLFCFLGSYMEEFEERR